MEKRVGWLAVLVGLGCVAAGAVTGAAAADGGGLEEGFRNPPASARPHTWWHWMNGSVTREGLTADLEAMQRVGIGGAQIFNVSESIPDGPAPFMSPAWLDLFQHAVAEAGRLGIELCFHNCAGWSSSGGPWVKPEHAMQFVTVSETAVHGPQAFAGALPQPTTRCNYYRDIAVLAFPTPAEPSIRVDISEVARVGANELVVEVTGLWPNRLIGDEQYPDDCEWRGKPLKAWPAWMVEGRPRPTQERLTFTTWKHWTKNDALLPSGWIGPAALLSAARVEVPAGQ